jgi:hypothetical protein
VIALVGTLGYILSFAIGAGPVTGLIVPEINKEAVRGETCTVWVLKLLHHAVDWLLLAQSDPRCGSDVDTVRAGVRCCA